MDAVTFAELQEALYLVFAPVLFWMLVLLLTGSILSVIGVAVLETVTRMTR